MDDLIANLIVIPTQGSCVTGWPKGNGYRRRNGLAPGAEKFRFGGELRDARFMRCRIGAADKRQRRKKKKTAREGSLLLRKQLCTRKCHGMLFVLLLGSGIGIGDVGFTQSIWIWQLDVVLFLLH